MWGRAQPNATIQSVSACICVHLRLFLFCVISGVATAASAAAQQTYVPEVGQEGKDVIWVPTPLALVEKMLDLAKVTSADFVIDLGSGDGRNVIAAAKRGARALGVEFNPDMVALAQKLAADAGVSDKATFVQGEYVRSGHFVRQRARPFSSPEKSGTIEGEDAGDETREPHRAQHLCHSRLETGRDREDHWRLHGLVCTALLYYVPAKPQ